MRSGYILMTLLTGLIITGCQSRPAIQTVSKMDLKRFMGDWYVIASIPTPFEKDVYNGVETYRLDEDGTVATTFTFDKGGFGGPRKVYRARGFVRDAQTGTVWGMQFIWPFKAEYRVIYLDAGYSLTAIGRTKRDYVWIMAREPAIPETDYARILKFLEEQGYDTGLLRKVPHAPRGSTG